VDQTKFFLNAYFDDVIGAGEGANVWKWTHKFIELDNQKGAKGDSLDEFGSHRFLESIGETLRVVELRETLREIDKDFNKRMAVVEFLCYKYGKPINELLNKPQGDPALLKVAEEKLFSVSEQFENLQKKLEEQKKSEEDSRKALDDQQKAEESLKSAESELRSAIDNLKAEEAKREAKKADLEKKSKDNANLVSMNRAVNELAQLNQEDPLPLRKAKLTQEAALKRVEKERKSAEVATGKAHAAASEAEEKTKQVEKSVAETEQALEAAKQYMDDVKKNSVPRGAIWWMERELEEKQKFLPKKKQLK